MNLPSPTWTDALYLIPTAFMGGAVGLVIVIFSTRTTAANVERRARARHREAARERARALRREERRHQRRRTD